MASFVYDDKQTWEYNLFRFVRWENPEDAKEDVTWFVNTFIRTIYQEECAADDEFNAKYR